MNSLWRSVHSGTWPTDPRHRPRILSGCINSSGARTRDETLNTRDLILIKVLEIHFRYNYGNAVSSSNKLKGLGNSSLFLVSFLIPFPSLTKSYFLLAIFIHISKGFKNCHCPLG